jgi:hypothetical protein
MLCGGTECFWAKTLPPWLWKRSENKPAIGIDFLAYQRYWYWIFKKNSDQFGTGIGLKKLTRPVHTRLVMLLNLFFYLSYQPSIGIRIQGWILVRIRQMCTWYWDWYGLGMKLILPQVPTRQVGTVSRLILFSILLVLVWTILWYQGKYQSIYLSSRLVPTQHVRSYW